MIGFLVSCVLLSVEAAIPEHEIKTLPGWDGALPSKHYAGYLSAGDEAPYEMYEHYYFVESENDPANDPFVVWTNGGPGASSLFGLFLELGPFYLDAASRTTAEFNKTGVPTLFRNDYSWTTSANLLILNSPPPVGYSYCDPAGPAGDGYSCGTWNDTRTATHNHAFLLEFAKSYPEYANHDLYVTGESYAGIYVPTLIAKLLDNPGTWTGLKGFAVGDGCVGTDVLCGPGDHAIFHVEFMHGHGQISEKRYKSVVDTCGDELTTAVESPQCVKALDDMETAIGAYYAYNLYDTCWYQNNLEPKKMWTGKWQGASTGAEPEEFSDALGGALNDYPCGGFSSLWYWLNTTEVRQALHVADNAYFFTGDNGVGFNYTSTEANLMPFYKYVALNTSLRVLVYNGDTDPSINSFATQNWTVALGLKETEEWRPWTIDSKSWMGGYVTRYEGDFDFLTIRGSGHMVPQFKPRETLEFLTRWLNNEDWKRYNP